MNIWPGWTFFERSVYEGYNDFPTFKTLQKITKCTSDSSTFISAQYIYLNEHFALTISTKPYLKDVIIMKLNIWAKISQQWSYQFIWLFYLYCSLQFRKCLPIQNNKKVQLKHMKCCYMLFTTSRHVMQFQRFITSYKKQMWVNKRCFTGLIIPCQTGFPIVTYTQCNTIYPR